MAEDKVAEWSEEAEWTLNGVKLTRAQAMTMRVALETFAGHIHCGGLGDDPRGKGIAAGYLARIKEIRKLLYGSKPKEKN